MPAGRFKATCLTILDEVEKTGETVVVTKHGRPVARLVPLESARPRFFVGSVKMVGDIVSPLLGDWELMK